MQGERRQKIEQLVVKKRYGIFIGQMLKADRNRIQVRTSLNQKEQTVLIGI